MTAPERFTTQLQAGLGMIGETLILLELWQPGMGAAALGQAALQSGRFPNVSARRLRNIVGECFAPRYLVRDGAPAALLKQLQPVLPGRELEQLMFVYTCRANAILAAFVREIYWGAYSAGRQDVSFDDALRFVTRANQEGRTTRPWSEITTRRVAGYLTGCCADFGLLEGGRKGVRKILPYRVEPCVAALLAYALHIAGLGDNSVIAHPDWGLFGMDEADVLNEMKRLALQGYWLVQAAGGVVRISWRYASMEELTCAIAEVELR